VDHVVNVYEAKTTLSRLLERVEQGEQIVVARAGRPVARLVPYQAAGSGLRLGVLAGQITLAPDFDDEDAMARLFESTHE
jgi:prevent-host-death family protein